MVLIFDTTCIRMRSHQESKVSSRTCFNPVINATVFTWFNYVLRTILVYLLYCFDVHVQNYLQLRNRMRLKLILFKNNDKMSLPQRSLPQRKYKDI